MFRTRHALEAVLMARTRPGQREPSLAAVLLGLMAFVIVVAACLYLAAALGS